MSDELRASLYAFDLTQERARRPAGAPDKALARPVTKIGVVGAGLMAAQIALLFARRLQVPVVLTDLDQARIDSGVGYVHGEIDKLADRQRISADQASRLRRLVTGSLSKEAFADADFVIEAVFEEMSVKQKVFAEVEAVVGPECVLATNTSSLLVTTMAAGKTLRKSCVLVRDAPAFVVNPLRTRLLGEVTAAVDEGTPLDVAEHALDPLGLPMSPFLLLPLVGPAEALHVAETLHEAFPARFAVSPKLRALVKAGKTAVYRPGLTIDPEVAELLAGGGRPSTADEVRQRALAGLAEEIRFMLDEDVVTAPQDIDPCLILGAGWPSHLGGITPYLDHAGIAEKVNGALAARW